jgi:hypothetical protein
MGSQLASFATSIPAPGGLVVPGSAGAGSPPPAATGTVGAAVIGGNGGNSAAAPVGGAPVAPAADDPAVVATLQQLVSIVQQLIAAASAQPAGVGVQGGGFGEAAAPLLASPALAGAANIGSGLAINAGIIGGGHFTSPVLTSTATASVIGGGDGGGSAAPVTVGTPLIGGGLAATTGQPTAPVVAAPVVAAPAVTGGGATAAPAATPLVDMQRVTGAPQPGGVIDAIIRSASVDQPPALSAGTWIEVADGAGARMQVHVHGSWAHHPQHILEGLRQGFLASHLHPDGTLHLHDVRA